MSVQLPSATKIRRRLGRAWMPFFGRFGALTEVQARTIPVVLRGHNVVVTAPTASGKTEAVVAPVAERHAEEGWPGLAVVYIVPTRALCNDLFARLEGPLGEMYLTAALKHGDHSQLPAREFHWLITTPESLDSILCRQTQLLETVRVVIVDEIHLLDGTYRGDQVRILLARLRRLTSATSLAVHLLSATLPDPDSIARRYMDAFEVITVGGPRPIQVHLLQTNEEVLQLTRERRWRKLLYFCNSRQKVEEIAGQLQMLWKPYPVVTHHGSLDRHQREEAEEVMKQNPVAVCVATSTLEIGIDIGNIDLIVLADPPWSLEALQQRVGRGSRRQDVIQAAAIFSTEDERDLLTLMFRAATSGAYRPVVYRPDLSVIIQQCLSLLFQHRTGIPRQDLMDLLGLLGTQEEVTAILEYLYDKGYSMVMRDSIFSSSDLLDLGDKGEIHSNVPDHGDYLVVNVDTGRSVGRIRGTFDQVFLLAGQSWKVLAVQGDRVMVRRHPRAVGTASFGMQRNVGRFHHLLPPELRSNDT